MEAGEEEGTLDKKDHRQGRKRLSPGPAPSQGGCRCPANALPQGSTNSMGLMAPDGSGFLFRPHFIGFSPLYVLHRVDTGRNIFFFNFL